MDAEAVKDGKKPRMVPTTVRYPAEAMAIIKDAAAEHDYSVSEFIRITTCHKLSRYLGSVVYVDAEQGYRIEEALLELMMEMEHVRRELHRIGVNFNQLVKQVNAERKAQLCVGTGPDERLLDRAELDALAQRFEDAAGKAGDALCRILN